MTIDQLRDELAELKGHTPLAGSDGWYKNPVTGHTYPHPVELSLDWLAAHGLPEGVTVRAIGRKYNAWYCDLDTNGDDPCFYGNEATAVHAFLAACVAAWKATKGTQ